MVIILLKIIRFSDPALSHRTNWVYSNYLLPNQILQSAYRPFIHSIEKNHRRSIIFHLIVDAHTSDSDLQSFLRTPIKGVQCLNK